MAAAGVEFGARVTRGRNRTDEGVLATMKLLVDAGANVNARSLIEPRAAGGRGGAAAAAGDSVGARLQQTVGAGRRASQMPSANAVPNQTALHGAAERGFDKFIEFLVANGADLQAKDASGRTPLDLVKTVAGNGRGGAESFPKTVALLESLMAAKGIPVPASK
jgi:ankyrin repeat protein